MRKDLVVILTALNLEYEAVRRKLDDPKVHRHERGTRFEVGTVQGTSCRVALGLTNKGNHSAAVIAERAIQEFTPAAVLFVGVAGALWSTARLGDVVMATHVYAYHGGTSEDDGLKSRPRVWETAHGISQLGSHVARVNDWADGATDRERAPQVRFGAIAAGEVVQNSRVSAEARWIRQHYNDALAIEMEAAGVAQAGHLNGAPVAIIRGISDRADGTKSSTKDRNWQPRAAANAAAFAARLAVGLVEEQEQTVMSQIKKDRGVDGPEAHISNTVHDSTVGIMAGSVTGSSVYMNTSPKVTGPADILAELEAFREHLRRHHAEGVLDDDIHREALTELGHARRAARENTLESPKRVTMALKRLRGLIADFPELAARLAPLVVATGELS
ncbi:MULTISPECIES: 5'-methylthioadenosine/S-adenosylhomocysteine nucleosidase [unclassified Streptomyces]|uniref:5'-methylthioadenosine/S-adenosylhomocysteine nucleosidase family protein n=1 Tax=unclassified Streptomyces TaxID=2593676 RepID=UPI00190797C1|nr:MULTISPECIES: 5'-methylthioadenosine/S-adenosylhomocysteine nucleosidase [unclassified Streptomyces]MCU4748091.1 5'-methylthioadenosine/S-adenosylhomocysteine nucleosidase [Streptomyces sp. G-5]QQN78691.1 5'-methylthioadenosine/S-adenosylhomocysteine nucleosidase [Streptomyces sp. XC 2026]